LKTDAKCRPEPSHWPLAYRRAPHRHPNHIRHAGRCHRRRRLILRRGCRLLGLAPLEAARRAAATAALVVGCGGVEAALRLGTPALRPL